MENEKLICCICGKEIKGEGHNAEPYVIDGLCCEKCNIEKVMPARIEKLQTLTTPNTKVGDKLLIVSMRNEPHYNGKKGTITHIDDIGQLHGTWGSLAVIPEEDEFVVYDEKFEI